MKTSFIYLVSAYLLLASANVFAQAGEPEPRGQKIARLKAEIAAAEGRVKTVVNQPVAHYPINTWVQLKVFSPGWFHAGANKPDYTKDVRATRELPYEKSEYVTSDVTPGMMFKGADLEFNANLKAYYTDRSLPKKKLTDAETAEINGLYRILARDSQELAELQNAWLPFSTFSEFLNSAYGTTAELLLLSLAGGILYVKLFTRRT